MINRMRAGGLIVVLCMSVVLVPNETFGRGGGLGGRGFAGRSVSIGSGFHRPVPRPQALLHRYKFGFRAPLRRQFGFGFPLAVGGGFGVPQAVPGGSLSYGSDNGPAGYSDRYFRPSNAEPDTITGAVPVGINPVIVYRPGCSTQTVTFPSEDGEESTINIVRC
jgi:hypothetical protein